MFSIIKLSREVMTAGAVDNKIVNESDSDLNFLLNHNYDLAGILILNLYFVAGHWNEL